MRKYKKPPVVERVVGIRAEIPEEVFQRYTQEWTDKFGKFFQDVETRTEWNVAIVEKNGMPVLDPDQQKMSIHQVFWQKRAEKRRLGLQLWSDKVAFNMVSDQSEPGQFEDLTGFVDKWLLEWAKHFKVETVKGATLEYVNMLSPKTIPSFYRGGTELRLDEILTYFAAMPDTVSHLVRGKRLLVPPYDFQINLRGGESGREKTFGARLRGEPSGEGLRLSFKASSDDGNTCINVTEVGHELSELHDVILHAFESFFTKKALETFEPYELDAPTES